MHALFEVNVADALVADAVAVKGQAEVALGDAVVLALDRALRDLGRVLPVVLPIVRRLRLVLDKNLKA